MFTNRAGLISQRKIMKQYFGMPRTATMGSAGSARQVWAVLHTARARRASSAPGIGADDGLCSLQEHGWCSPNAAAVMAHWYRPLCSSTAFAGQPDLALAAMDVLPHGAPPTFRTAALSHQRFERPPPRARRSERPPRPLARPKREDRLGVDRGCQRRSASSPGARRCPARSAGVEDHRLMKQRRADFEAWQMNVFVAGYHSPEARNSPMPRARYPVPPKPGSPAAVRRVLPPVIPLFKPPVSSWRTPRSSPGRKSWWTIGSRMRRIGRLHRYREHQRPTSSSIRG